MASDRTGKTLELERLAKAKAIDELNQACNREVSTITSTGQRSGGVAAAVRNLHEKRAKSIVEKTVELRRKSLEIAPELGSGDQFRRLLEELEKTVDTVYNSIPEHVRRACGRTGLVHANDGAMQLKGFARREVEIMKHEFELQSEKAKPAPTKYETPVPMPAPIKHEMLIPTPDPRRVFVVHGRNTEARDAMFAFLRAIGLEPLEWSEAVALTTSGSPFNGEVLDRAFSQVKAVVVLLTGDDVARLGTRYQNEHDAAHERELTPQARPNVLFEAGMAFGRHPEQTILVSLGPTRPFSDVAGRNEVRISDRAPDRQALVGRLKTLGCAVNTDNKTDWLSAGGFDASVRAPDSVSGGAIEMKPTDSVLPEQPSRLVALQLEGLKSAAQKATDAEQITDNLEAIKAFFVRNPDLLDIGSNGEFVNIYLVNVGRWRGANPQVVTNLQSEVRKLSATRTAG